MKSVSFEKQIHVISKDEYPSMFLCRMFGYCLQHTTVGQISSKLGKSLGYSPVLAGFIPSPVLSSH